MDNFILAVSRISISLLGAGVEGILVVVEIQDISAATDFQRDCVCLQIMVSDTYGEGKRNLQDRLRKGKR